MVTEVLTNLLRRLKPVEFISPARTMVMLVVNHSIPENAKVSFVNGNDGTCEGITYNDMPVFTVQFHPEACGGPQDTAFLFDKFVSMMD